MRLVAFLVTAGVAATLAGAGSAVTLERNRYDQAMRPLLVEVTEPTLFEPSRIFLDSPFFLAAERIRGVPAPRRVRREQQRLVDLLTEAESAVSEAFSSWSFPARERAERTVRAIYATIRAMCAKGYDVATICDA